MRDDLEFKLEGIESNRDSNEPVLFSERIISGIRYLAEFYSGVAIGHTFAAGTTYALNKMGFDNQSNALLTTLGYYAGFYLGNLSSILLISKDSERSENVSQQSKSNAKITLLGIPLKFVANDVLLNSHVSPIWSYVFGQGGIGLLTGGTKMFLDRGLVFGKRKKENLNI